MKLIVCVDDELGIRFNHRRQSRDRVLIQNLTAQLGGAPLHLTPYSVPLFSESTAKLLPSVAPYRAADVGDYCFLEDAIPEEAFEKTEELILYRWNRLYPADVYFTHDLSRFHLVSTEEFVGSSHDKITKEIWKP